MVQRHTVVLVDDVDGGAATETITFELDGVGYEIDLSEEHARDLRDAIHAWVTHARRQPHGPTAPSPRLDSGGPPLYDPKAVRAFAAARGLTVSARGRPPKHVLEEYFAAGN